MPLPRLAAVTVLERLQDFAPALSDPEEWAIATVVAASGSVPRPPGTSMAVRRDALAVGSLSGGCVEAAVVDACLTVLETGTAGVVEFGYGDEDGLGVGLTCGGSLQVLAQPMTDLRGALPSLAAALEDLPVRAVALLRALPGAAVDLPAPALLDPAAPLPAAVTGMLPERSAQELRSALEAGGTRTVPVHGAAADGCPVLGRLLVESHRPPPRLIVYGANDYAAALAAAARPLGWRVTVCDARPLFSTAARHPSAHEVVAETPAVHLRSEHAAGRLDSRTAVAVLGHDPRFDLAVLDQALRMDLAYVGAMGSRTTHGRRAEDLLRGGLPEGLLSRLHSPIGLDIGALTPEEVAVAILAEIIATRRGRDRAVHPLRDTAGPVHAPRGMDTAPASWKVHPRWT
jgi:xanthine dehydrogenase accessory factor